MLALKRAKKDPTESLDYEREKLEPQGINEFPGASVWVKTDFHSQPNSATTLRGARKLSVTGHLTCLRWAGLDMDEWENI